MKILCEERSCGVLLIAMAFSAFWGNTSLAASKQIGDGGLSVKVYVLEPQHSPCQNATGICGKFDDMLQRMKTGQGRLLYDFKLDSKTGGKAADLNRISLPSSVTYDEDHNLVTNCTQWTVGAGVVCKPKENGKFLLQFEWSRMDGRDTDEARLGVSDIEPVKHNIAIASEIPMRKGCMLVGGIGSWPSSDNVHAFLLVDLQDGAKD